MGRAENRRTASTGGGGGGSGGSATGGFTAPTPGLEDVKFAVGTPEAAEMYEKSVERLREHLGVQPWKGISEVTQAIEKMENTVFGEPREPVRLTIMHDKVAKRKALIAPPAPITYCGWIDEIEGFHLNPRSPPQQRYGRRNSHDNGRRRTCVIVLIVIAVMVV